MPAEAAASTTETTCKQCKAAIPVDAKLCRHCNSYQDWRGHMHFSSTVLALLVALASVLSIGLPVVLDAFKPRGPQIALSSPTIRGEAVYLLASNTGGGAGVIQRGVISSRYFDPIAYDLEPISGDDAFIEPGTKYIGLKARLLLGAADSRLIMLDAVVDASRRNGRDQAGLIEIWRQTPTGAVKNAPLPVSYEDLVALLEAHASRCEASTAKPTLANGCAGLRELQRGNDRAHAKLQNALDKASAPTPAGAKATR